MNSINIIIACIIAFAVSIFSVSIGGTSLITVPVLIWAGMSSKNAIATNMLALVFLSLGGAIGFRKEAHLIDYKEIAFLSIPTIIGSFIGANIVLTINQNILKKVLAVIICVIAGFLFLRTDLGIQKRKRKAKTFKFILGGFAIFILGIYGGFFSGGYVTILSYILILCFSFSFLQTAFITKILNIFSSLIASILFCHKNWSFPKNFK